LKASSGVPLPFCSEHAVALFCISLAILQSKRVTPELLMSRLPLLSQVVDLASAYYDRRDSSPVFPHVTPELLRKALGAGTPVPERGRMQGKSSLRWRNQRNSALLRTPGRAISAL
jgi:hypothetical protein